MARTEECQELIILIGRLHSDLQVYCEAVALLGHRDGVTTLDAAYERSERARMAFAAARERLKMHIVEHGCGS